MNKKITYSTIGLALFLCSSIQAQINSDFIGQNTWLPGTFTDFLQSPPVDYYPSSCSYCATASGHTHNSTQTAFGQLDNQWTNIQNSGSRMVRIGGTDYNIFKHENWDYRWQVEQIKSRGMIPIVQVGVGTPTSLGGTEGNFPSNGSGAASLVTYLNITNASTSFCQYWIIGNEYDLIGYTAAECYTKISTFSAAMRTANGTTNESDPNKRLIIIGPELASYSPGNTTYVNALTSGSTNILPYIDIFSFHMYPSATITSCSDSSCTGDRNTFINYAQNSFVPKLTSLKTKISSMPIAITEFNVTSCEGLCHNWDSDPVNGLDARSFIAGQLIADLLATGMGDGQVQFMNMWSVSEGGPDRGYIQNSTGNPRSSYYHFQMMKNFKGTYTAGTVTTGQTDFKGFGSYDGNQIAVLIMNQRNNTGGSYTYTIRFDNNTNSGSGVKIKIPGPNLAVQYTDAIDDQSSTLLVFDQFGSISMKKNYKLSDGLSAPANPYCGTSITYDDQTALGNYNPGVYSDITIGNGSNSITIGSTNNHIYRAVNSITINKEFTVPVGQTFELLPSASDCQ